MGFSVSSWNPVHLGFIFPLEYTHFTLFFMPRTGFFSLRQQRLDKSISDSDNDDVERL